MYSTVLVALITQIMASASRASKAAQELESALNRNSIPADALHYHSREYRGVGTVAMPVHLLTHLTAAEQDAYEKALVADAPDPVYPLLLPWNEQHEGTLQDMYRIWRDEANSDFASHFAFFIDREAVEKVAIVVAQPDDYTMLFSAEADSWVRTNLTSYLRRHKPEIDHQEIAARERGAYEGYLETLAHDILGHRALTYGRVPASAFDSVWGNLDLANLDMSELVEYHGEDSEDGGEVKMVENESWNADAVIARLWEMIEEDSKEEGREL